jgi:hypothetical protein
MHRSPSTPAAATVTDREKPVPNKSATGALINKGPGPLGNNRKVTKGV